MSGPGRWLAGGLSLEECLEAIRSQFWRVDEDWVIRFNLTGWDKIRDYPEVDFQKFRAEMPLILECQFAIGVTRREKVVVLVGIKKALALTSEPKTIETRYL